YDARLVSIKAQVVAQDCRGSGAVRSEVLTLDAGGHVFEAILETEEAGCLEGFANGSYLQATGICSLQPGELNRGRSVKVLLRSTEDLLLLNGPPWWVVRHTGRLLAGATALALFGVGWAWLLRQQVRQRTAQLELARRELNHALAHEKELGQLKTAFANLVS